jgi:glycosyltransferase involved in cell wall biosynthesis
MPNLEVAKPEVREEAAREKGDLNVANRLSSDGQPVLLVSVIIAARNEARNLPSCLQSLRNCGEVFVIDSQSSDATAQIAQAYGAKVVQFHYAGGWPKKRQWAMESLPLAYDWTLLLDADEALTPQLIEEMCQAVQSPDVNGYYLGLQMYFLGRPLRYSGAKFYKLALFRTGKARFECRLRDQDASMCDMEVHEHVIVDGLSAKLRNPVMHHNVESLSRYIQKHNEYSNWDAKVWLESDNSNDLPPSLFGNQAQRRRWLRKHLFAVPGSPVLLFLYRYFFCLGFLDGIPGLIYCAFQGIQFFNIKAKIYELRITKG